jgi:hypothetical protein
MKTVLKGYNTNFFRSTWVLSLFLVLLAGCQGCEESQNTWDGCLDESGLWPANMEQSLASYYKASVAKEPESVGECSVYIDYSDGIMHAWSNLDNGKLLKEIVEQCSGNSSWNAKYFPLFDNKIQDGQSFTTGAEQGIMNPASYTGKMAPIDLALKKIVSGNDQAVLITDMELYESNNTSSATIKTLPWSTEDFKTWLAKGNSVEVVYAPDRYQDKAVTPTASKYLYFIFFVPKGITPEKSLFANFNSADTQFAKQFSMNAQPTVASNNYGGVDKTGLNEAYDSKDGNLKISNAWLKNKANYEFIDHQGFNWNYVNELIQSGSGPKTDFLRKLFFDFSNNSTFSIDDVDVEVYEVSEDLVRFAKCDFGKALKPKIIKDANQGDVWDDSVSPLEREVFEMNTDKLKSEFIYTAPAFIVIPEVFEVNKTLFQNGLSQDRSKVELALNFHPNFNYEKFSSSANGLFRIDIVVKNASFNASNPQLPDLKWTGVGGDNFHDALVNLGNTPSGITCQPIGDNHRVLYTYFVRMQPN